MFIYYNFFSDVNMKLFEILKKYTLVKNGKNLQTDGTKIYVESSDDSKKQEEVLFESQDIVPISEDGIIDTNSALARAKYKSNLINLVNQLKKDGTCNKYKIIRNDDFFPYNWEWTLSSIGPELEKCPSTFTYLLRRSIAIKNASSQLTTHFGLAPSSEELKPYLEELDPDLGYIYKPLTFRSTKHFTVNIPLPYTFSYNWISSERNFTIIDDIDNLVNSGYAYSLGYFDTYLDITHEPLKISKNAIVIIAEDKYKEIIKNPIIANELRDRRVVLYKGDEGLAINMFLTELGVLPYRVEEIFFRYDSQTQKILEDSFQTFAEKNNIDYNIGHGNINGVGGHFSSFYDNLNNSANDFKQLFIDFLLKKFPEYSDIIDISLFSVDNVAKQVIDNIGTDKLLLAISEFNEKVKKGLIANTIEYKNDRNNITPEISSFFKRTLFVIKQYYSNTSLFNFSSEETRDLQENIKNFFHSYSVEEQLYSAVNICKQFDIDYNIEINQYNTK